MCDDVLMCVSARCVCFLFLICGINGRAAHPGSPRPAAARDTTQRDGRRNASAKSEVVRRGRPNVELGISSVGEGVVFIIGAERGAAVDASATKLRDVRLEATLDDGGGDDDAPAPG